MRPISKQPAVAGMVSGEFDHITEANDAFLDLIGYTREDLLWEGNSIGPTSHRRSTHRWTNWRTKKGCASEPAHHVRKC